MLLKRKKQWLIVIQLIWFNEKQFWLLYKNYFLFFQLKFFYYLPLWHPFWYTKSVRFELWIAQTNSNSNYISSAKNHLLFFVYTTLHKFLRNPFILKLCCVFKWCLAALNIQTTHNVNIYILTLTLRFLHTHVFSWGLTNYLCSFFHEVLKPAVIKNALFFHNFITLFINN